MRFVILSFILLIGCRSKGKIIISDVTRDTSITIFTKKIKPPVMLKLHIKGYTNSSFIVNNYFYFPGGNIDTTIQHDWYNNTIRINYKTKKIKKGYLTIDYEL
jgi:uncharacterized protein YcfL